MEPSAAEDAPDAPANLAFQVSGTTVILTWSAPTGAAVASFTLEAGSASGLSDIVNFSTGSAATTFTATNVPSGTYFVRVRAQNADGTSGPSNEVVITVVVDGGPCPTPAAPTGFTATATGNTVTLTWHTVAGALSFVIEAGSAPGATDITTFDTGSAATTFSTTAPDGTYYVRIRVRTGCGTSAASTEAVLTVAGGGPPGPPTGLTGRWIGLVANGDGLRSPTFCDERWDWQLDLTQTGSNVTGMLTQTDVMPCPDSGPVGRVSTAPLTGTAGDGTFTFTITLPNGRSMVGNATISGSRMTGSTTHSLGATGTFAVNKQ